MKNNYIGIIIVGIVAIVLEHMLVNLGVIYLLILILNHLELQ